MLEHILDESETCIEICRRLRARGHNHALINKLINNFRDISELTTLYMCSIRISPELETMLITRWLVNVITMIHFIQDDLDRKL